MSTAIGLKDLGKTIISSKSGLIGLLILLTVLGISIFALICVPFDIVRKWNDPTFWQDNPKVAAPQWFSQIIGKNLPPTIHLSPQDFNKYEYGVTGLKYVVLESRIKYNYDDFPSELFAAIYANFSGNNPLATIKLMRPDGLEVTIFHGVLKGHVNLLFISSDFSIKEGIRNSLANLGAVSNSTGTIYPEICLFAVKDENMFTYGSAKVLKGTYKIRMEIICSNVNDTADAKFTIYGKVYGLAGTDNLRRDLFTGIVWGAPVALAFGLSAAIATSIIQSLIGALSAWYGGLVDEIIQRVTEVYMILPFLPFLIMISIFYRVNLWLLVLLIIALSIFGGITKTARSVTFQIISEQYIESAISYGASKMRILFLYIMPRLLPYIVANIVLNVPAFVFLEAALSILGLGDPTMPTWGKVISEAYSNGALIHGYWWWILIPAFLIILTASAFALIGYALDKFVNPRLRER